MKKRLRIIIGIFLLLPASIAIAQDSWTQKADFGGVARHAAAGFVINTKAYIGTGTDDVAFFKDFWEWDQAADRWTQMADFPGAARREAIGFSIGTKGYIGTGCCPGFKDLWEWEGDTNSPNYNTWTRKADFPGGIRTTMIAFTIANKAYIGLGEGVGGFKSDIWEYDPVADTWTQLSDFPGPARTDAVSFSLGDKGYVGIGDKGGLPMLDDFWEYDAIADTWTRKADFPGGPRTTTTAFSIPSLGKGFIGMGDDDDSTLYADFWEWDQLTDSWTQRADFGGGVRSDENGFCIGNKGYVGMGSLGGSPNFNDFWEYSPLGITSIPDKFNTPLFEIFPNPASTSFTLVVSGGTFTNAEIISLQGSVLKNISLNSSQTKVSIADLNSGLYLIKMLGNEQVIVRKFIIH